MRIDRLDARVSPLRQAQVRPAEPVGVLGIGWCQINQGPVFVGQAQDIVEALTRVRPLQVHGWLPRHQLRGARELGQRRSGLVEREQARAGEQVSGAERRVETGRRAEFDERFRVLAAPLQDDAEVVPDEGAIAASKNHRAERGFGRVEPARRQRRDTFVEPRGQRRRQVLRTAPPSAGTNSTSASAERSRARRS